MKCLRIVSLILLSMAAGGQADAQPGFDAEWPDVHDPVMARGEDGRYYVFSTGMGIGVMSSADMKTWRQEPPVFKIERAKPQEGEMRPRHGFEIDWQHSTLPRWGVDSIRGYRGHVWAPDISWHDGRWLLYYSCSTFGKNRSAIGLATNKTLDPTSPDYGWTDEGSVIVSHQHQDNWNAIDPNLIVDQKGQPWLTFGSFWDGIQLTRLSNKDFRTPVGKMKTIARRMGRKLTLAEIDRVENFTIEGNDTVEAGENAVEAPFIMRHGKYYYLFVSFDYCCRGERSTYKTVYGRSKRVDGPYLDRTGKRMDRGGGTLLYGPDADNYGIGHCAVYEWDGQCYFVSHAYDKQARGGGAKLFIRKLEFDDEGWIRKKVE